MIISTGMQSNLTETKASTTITT